MSDLIKNINKFFKFSTKKEIVDIENNLILDEHLQKVFKMFYIEHKDINFIADFLGYSRGKIEADLRIIRKKLSKLI